MKSIYFEVVWTHEYIRYAFAHDAHDPFIEISRGILSHGIGNFGFNKAINTINLRESERLMTTDRVGSVTFQPDLQEEVSKCCFEMGMEPNVALTTHTKHVVTHSNAQDLRHNLGVIT